MNEQEKARLEELESKDAAWNEKRRSLIRVGEAASEILACLAQRSPDAEVLWSFGTAADFGEEAELFLLRSC